jgi:hypothetical protein
MPVCVNVTAGGDWIPLGVKRLTSMLHALRILASKYFRQTVSLSVVIH